MTEDKDNQLIDVSSLIIDQTYSEEVDIHGRFLSELRKSLDTVLWVARKFVLIGLEARVAGMRFAKTHYAWGDSVDEGHDLEVDGLKINVKQSTRRFSSPQEFAGYFSNAGKRPILVTTIHTKIPDVILIVSNDRKGGMVIRKETKEHWGVRKAVYDKRYRSTSDCWDISAEHVDWITLDTLEELERMWASFAVPGSPQ